MNLDEIKDVLFASGLVKNERQLNRYLKIMSHYKTAKLQKKNFGKGEIESHHILPSKMWPEYDKEKWNLVNLPVRMHVIVHYLLYKALKSSICVYAFNQMSRVSVRTGKLNTRLYAAMRIELAKLISDCNTGRKWKPEQYEKHTLSHGGKNTYVNVDTGERRKFIVGDEPPGWIPFQTGRVRTEQSKQDMAIKMAGRIWQYNSNTRELKFTHEILEGYSQGLPDWFDNGSEVIKGYKWAHDPVTNKHIRCNPEDVPDGYIIGRNYHNKGYEKINHSGLVKMLDVEAKKYVLVSKDILPNPKYVNHGSSLNNIFVIQYNNETHYSWDSFLEAFPEIPNVGKIRDETVMNKPIPSKHFNQSPERQDFCIKHKGLTFGQAGILIRRLLDNND